MISSLLHEPGSRPAWRALFLMLLMVVGVFAFGPAPAVPDMAGSDKLNHLLAFLALGSVACFASAPGWRPTTIIALGLLLYGGFIEVVQARLPHRHGDWADLAADAVGLSFGLLLAAGLRRATHTRQKKQGPH